MKILFATDLHGSGRKYQRLADLAREGDTAAVVNGGDLLPHGAAEQARFLAEELPRHFEQFARAGIPYLCLPGNDDPCTWDEPFQQLCDRFPGVRNLAQAKASVGAYDFVGMNWVVDYPFRLKDRCRMDSRDHAFCAQLGTAVLSTPLGRREVPDWEAYARTLPTIRDELERLPEPADPRHAVYVTHMPPARLGLDVCGDWQQVGSLALHEFLHRRQPRLSLHGHIHESPHMFGVWRRALGETICVQPGQEERGFTYVVIDLVTLEMERYTEDWA